VGHASAMGCLFNFRKPAGVSYQKDIAPIFAKCNACHSQGRITPDLSSYSQILGASSTIRETLMTQRMPPWWPDPAYGRFALPFALNSEEVRTLVTWIDSGLPRESNEDH